MIRSFTHRGLKRFFEHDDTRRLPQETIPRIRHILTQLEETEIIEDMDIHSWHLHELKGNRKGTWSVTVRANWRITFQFQEGEAYNVNFEDYH